MHRRLALGALGVCALIGSTASCTGNGSEAAAPGVTGSVDTAVTVRNVPRVPTIDAKRVPSTPELMEGLFAAGSEMPPVSPVCRAWTLAGPLFPTNSVRLDQAAEAVVNKLAAELASSVGRIEIGGHADERNTTYPGGNVGLSKGRAETVIEELVERGVGRSRFLPPVAHGASVPIDTGHSEAAYRVNRRVEVKLICD